VQVIEQRPDGAKVEDAQSTPILLEHPREDRQHSGLCLPSRSGGDNHDVITPQYYRDYFLLERPELSPTETIDDMVLKAWM
jgi:hypothetical protein